MKSSLNNKLREKGYTEDDLKGLGELKLNEVLTLTNGLTVGIKRERNFAQVNRKKVNQNRDANWRTFFIDDYKEEEIWLSTRETIAKLKEKLIKMSKDDVWESQLGKMRRQRNELLRDKNMLESDYVKCKEALSAIFSIVSELFEDIN